MQAVDWGKQHLKKFPIHDMTATIPAQSDKNTGHLTGLQKPISLHLLGITVFSK